MIHANASDGVLEQVAGQTRRYESWTPIAVHSFGAALLYFSSGICPAEENKAIANWVRPLSANWEDRKICNEMTNETSRDCRPSPGSCWMQPTRWVLHSLLQTRSRSKAISWITSYGINSSFVAGNAPQWRLTVFYCVKCKCIWVNRRAQVSDSEYHFSHGCMDQFNIAETPALSLLDGRCAKRFKCVRLLCDTRICALRSLLSKRSCAISEGGC